MPSNQHAHRVGRLVRILASYGIGGACLYWVFHDLQFQELLRSLEGTRWPWLVPATLMVLLVYVCAGWEWQILLRPVGKVSVLRTTQAVFAGRFANDVLPVHAGYLVRIYLVSRWMQVAVAKIVPSLLVERLFDGLWLALGIGLTALFFPLPPKITGSAEVWAGIILFGLVALAVIVFRRRPNEGVTPSVLSRWRWGRKMQSFSGQILQEIRLLARSWSSLAALGLSLLKLLVQGLAFLILLWAYGFELSLIAQCAVFLIAYVGISIPSTPASVGVFQFFCISGLQLVGVSKAPATGFALLAFVVLTAPLSVAGFLALAQSGLSLSQMRHEVRRRLSDNSAPK